MVAKTITSTVLLLGLIVINTGFTQAQGHSAAVSRAVESDTVWVIMNHVKADMRDQFEKFVEEIFWSRATRLGEAEKRVFNQTRVLYPTAAEDDGTYTYIFLADPFIPDADYSIEHFLTQMYGAEKAAEYFQMFEETQAGPQTLRKLVQTRY
jgi:hypothetical protein